MIDFVRHFLMLICMVGLGCVILCFVMGHLLPLIANRFSKVICLLRNNGILALAIPFVFTLGMIVYGSTKNSATVSFAPVNLQIAFSASATQHVCTNDFVHAPVCMESWYRRGAWNDGCVLTFDDDWRFPYASNHLSKIEIWSQGLIYATEKDSNPVIAMSMPLALKPYETKVLYGRTTNDSYRVVWLDAHPNRSASLTTDSSIELFRNGDMCRIENGVSTRQSYQIPFAHNGFGQDEDWIRTNFTNSDEILSAGYANWARQKIGVGQSNGYYLFTASFVNSPVEATRLFVGDMSVAVTNAGEYVFVLEKGFDYDFGTWPLNGSVKYSMRDDLGEDAEIVSASSVDGTGIWTRDGGSHHIMLPTAEKAGNLLWMPILHGDPDVVHLYPDSLPMSFHAVLTDFCRTNDVTYHWYAADAGLQFASPDESETEVNCLSVPSWRDTSIKVTASVGDHDLTSSLNLTIGTNFLPQVRVSMVGSPVVWVNRPREDANIRRFSLIVDSDVPTNGTIEVTFSGDPSHADVDFLIHEMIQINEATKFPCEIGIADVEGLKACDSCGEESFVWRFETADGDVMEGRTSFTVAEIQSVDVHSDRGGVSANPPPFPGQTNATFDVRHSPSPDRHYPVFFSDVVDSNLNVIAYSVNFEVNVKPADFIVPNGWTTLSRISGPESGIIRNCFGKTASLDTPNVGGVYKIGVRYSDSPLTETVLLLPLSGASVDDVITNDIKRADDFASYIKLNYSKIERQWPKFGLTWFYNNEMGDYLGRVDVRLQPTIWVYNQVNDDSGMGAVATWNGVPTRMAKASNFLVGYATKKIGVYEALRSFSQLLGTSNDETALMSWNMGSMVADGSNYCSVVTSMSTNMWKRADVKEKRLWPNLIQADNHLSHEYISDYNVNFISPGFLEKRIK